MSGENNGALAEGRPVKIIYETHNGETVYIDPINLAMLRAIQLKAGDKFPYPAKEPYQVPDPAEVAFNPEQTSRAEDNPKYVTDCQAVDRERKQWVDRTIFDYTVTFPKYSTRDALIDAYRGRLDYARSIGKLPDDDYDAVLFYLILKWNRVTVDDGKLDIADNEYGYIIRMAIQTVALTASEVAQGVRFFRPQVSGR